MKAGALLDEDALPLEGGKASHQEERVEEPAAAAAAPWPSARLLIGYFSMCVGMFMAILDIQIVAASINQIQAGLAASPDEVSWVQTSYLIAEVVMIPLSGILTRALSSRTLFCLSCAGFTLASALCATATSIEEMILYRALQGFIGGAMIPTVYAASFRVFGARRSIGIVITSLIVTLAPTVGPVIGGWLSGITSWHWLFLINVPAGILATITVWFYVDIDRGDRRLLDTFDYLGLVLMALFLCALQYVVEEGARKNWFENETISYAAATSAIAGVLFFWRTLTARYPIVNLHVFTNRNFVAGGVLGFLVGMSLFGVIALMPLFLGRIAGYNSTQIGFAIMVSGLSMLTTAPVVAFIGGRIGMRPVAVAGFVLLALSSYTFSTITSEWGAVEFVLPQIFRGVGTMSAIIAISQLSFATLTQEEIKDASGMYTLLRNLGGAFGLAGINTLLIERTRFHWEHLSAAADPGRRSSVAGMLGGLESRFGDFMLADPHLAALRALGQLLEKEAATLAFADCFWMLCVVLGFAAFVPLFIRGATPGAAPVEAE